MSKGIEQDESVFCLQHAYFGTKHSLSLFPLIGRKVSHDDSEWIRKAYIANLSAKVVRSSREGCSLRS